MGQVGRQGQCLAAQGLDAFDYRLAAGAAGIEMNDDFGAGLGKRIARPCPRPLPLPVMSATRPVRSNSAEG
ncbi:hypothetical protein [Candidatus Amarobacter glycogenicus]|uniref:hypothetical protein n=1 Tax=Candidatus Amarobacter glycogenicus TaxID=3140699 RepID=UPI0031CCD299